MKWFWLYIAPFILHVHHGLLEHACPPKLQFMVMFVPCISVWVKLDDNKGVYKWLSLLTPENLCCRPFGSECQAAPESVTRNGWSEDARWFCQAFPSDLQYRGNTPLLEDSGSQLCRQLRLHKQLKPQQQKHTRGQENNVLGLHEDMGTRRSSQGKTSHLTLSIWVYWKIYVLGIRCFGCVWMAIRLTCYTGQTPQGLVFLSPTSRFRGALGAWVPLAPKIYSKSCSFQGIIRAKPLFWAIFRLRAPPLLGSKLHWAPLIKILDPRLSSQLPFCFSPGA